MGKLMAKNKPLSYEDYVEGTRKVLEDSKQEKEPYTTIVAGEEFIVLPNVFSPKYFNDTELFALNLPIKEGDEMLEIGPGTGVISIMAAKKGAKRVVAIDINPDAVKNTELNIEKHNVRDRVEVRHGNLYEPLREGEVFDVIFWNTPFGLVEEKDIPALEKAVYDPGYKATERFIKEVKAHLKPDGRVLIGFSSTLGRTDLLEQFAQDVGLRLRLLFEAESQETHSVKFEIFEAM